MNVMCVDLHTHSIYSDGTATPAELIGLATKLGLSALALTDHDTVAGVSETIHHGEQAGIRVVSGIEVSAVHQDLPLHILGYGIDLENQMLNHRLNYLQEGRKNRNRAIIGKLQHLGITVEMEDLVQFSQVGQTGRPHIAKLLIHKGVVKTMEQAFSRYLRRGAAAWAERVAFSAADTIAMIHEAGGLAVLAHPGLLDQHMRVQPILIAELHKMGLDGLEAYYPKHSSRMTRLLLELADTYHLVVTGGSDYHGNHKPGGVLAGGRNGFCPPDCIWDKLFARLGTSGTPVTSH